MKLILIYVLFMFVIDEVIEVTSCMLLHL